MQFHQEFIIYIPWERKCCKNCSSNLMPLQTIFLRPNRHFETMTLHYKFSADGCLKPWHNTKFQIIIIYMVEVILKVKCSNDSRLHMCRALMVTNPIYKHISFDFPNNPRGRFINSIVQTDKLNLREVGQFV